MLPQLSSAPEWIAFCRRETPYCFVEQPDCLVDFQSNHLVITLLNRQVRNGKEAIKYSIGSAQSIEPAWNFIKACQFDLGYMVQGLEQVNFEGNARDNSGFPALQGIGIRKFFAKERAVISPAVLGVLEPLKTLPEHWDLHNVCRLLANRQVLDLRHQPLAGNAADDAPASADALLLELVERPDGWRVRSMAGRICVARENGQLYSFIPQLAESRRGLSRIA
ncbi:hypothetical protein [Motiliproteus sp. SC1-56]|uniref:hypothetical protein n=1 Tax=Motiliproteus sp. SC1-56 TaxID=2799565 RepID=UPI001A8D24D1|nr:hypothetical protein [Motiliproteus sp. SC1-56]